LKRLQEKNLTLEIASIIHIVIFCKMISWGWLKKLDKDISIMTF